MNHKDPFGKLNCQCFYEKTLESKINFKESTFLKVHKNDEINVKEEIS